MPAPAASERQFVQGSRGVQVGSRAHHTEHLWAGFMGESLGQWKARPNSSNWDTLPSTLGQGRDPQSVWHRPPYPSCPFPPRPAPTPDTRRGRGPGGQVGVPVVLRCVLVGQHLQVDGLRPPLDAPVLGQDGGGGEERGHGARRPLTKPCSHPPAH